MALLSIICYDNIELHYKLGMRKYAYALQLYPAHVEKLESRQPALYRNVLLYSNYDNDHHNNNRDN